MMDKRHRCADINELLKTTAINIENYGLQVIMVNGSSYLPSFAYSIGLWKTYKHPEIICFGLGNDTGHAIINDVADLIKNGERIEIGKRYLEILKDTQTTFLEVDTRNINDYFTVTQSYYKDEPFPAFQLVWPDRKNKFPWEEEFEKVFRFKQPLLDRNGDFKFREPKNLCIFTTRQWLELDQPILRVAHDHDGDWQFLTGDQLPEDAKIVALKEILLKDSSLNELFNLDYGEAAERPKPGEKWKRYKIEKEEPDQ